MKTSECISLTQPLPQDNYFSCTKKAKVMKDLKIEADLDELMRLTKLMSERNLTKKEEARKEELCYQYIPLRQRSETSSDSEMSCQTLGALEHGDSKMLTSSQLSIQKDDPKVSGQYSKNPFE